MRRVRAGAWWIAAIAFAGVCAALAFDLYPLANNYNGNDSQRLIHLANARALSTATLLYVTDNDEVFPPALKASVFEREMNPYLKRVETPIGSPVYEDADSLIFEELAFNLNLSGVVLYRISDPAKQCMVYDNQPMSSGDRVVAYTDGSLALISQFDWWDVVIGMKPRLLPEDLATVRRLGQGMKDYLVNHQNRFPQVTSIAGLKAEIGYFLPKTVWSVKSKPVSFNRNLSGEPVGAIANPKETPEFLGPLDSNGRQAVYFVDGHDDEVILPLK